MNDIDIDAVESHLRANPRADLGNVTALGLIEHIRDLDGRLNAAHESIHAIVEPGMQSALDATCSELAALRERLPLLEAKARAWDAKEVYTAHWSSRCETFCSACATLSAKATHARMDLEAAQGKQGANGGEHE